MITDAYLSKTPPSQLIAMREEECLETGIQMLKVLKVLRPDEKLLAERIAHKL